MAIPITVAVATTRPKAKRVACWRSTRTSACSTNNRSSSIFSPLLQQLSLLLQILLLTTTTTTTVVRVVDAFVPPRPGTDLAATYEPVHLYRQRLGIVYNYTPTFLHPEICRYLTEEECRKGDETMIEHGKRNQAIQKSLYRQRQRHLQLQQRQHREHQEQEERSKMGMHNNNTKRLGDSVHDQQQKHDYFQEFQDQLGAFTKAYGLGQTPPTLEEELAELEELLVAFNTTREQQRRQNERHLQSIRSEHVYNPSVGNFVVPIFLMIFTDHKDRKLPAKYEYQILWNLRIRKWIDENSYGRYTAFFDVQDWMMTDNTEDYYSEGKSGRVSGLQKAWYPLMDAMDERLGGDWSIYDADGDGYIDNCFVVHSGYAAEEGGEDCTNGRKNENRIWSHAFPDAGQWSNPTNGKYKLRGYMITSGLDLTCDSNPSKMGVMTHEMMHTFFLIDLYDTQFKGKGLGNYDIMGYPYGVANDGYIPMGFSTWSKTAIEWQTCTKITASGEYSLAPTETTDSCYHLTLNDFTGNEEYILFENRQQNGFDIKLWAAGLLMYHVDEAADDQVWTGYPGEPDWPENGDHYRVALIQADGNYDLEKGVNIGDAGDIWLPGMILTPNTDGQTYPNTDSYQDGYIIPTGITIEVLENDGMNVRFQVTMGERTVDFAAPRKEGNPLAAHHHQDQPQFPDDPELDISGKIPQLPWYDEWRNEQQQGEILAEQGQQRPSRTGQTSGEQQHADGSKDSSKASSLLDQVYCGGSLFPALSTALLLLHRIY